MGNRRFAQISTSDEDEEEEALPRQHSSNKVEGQPRLRRLKRMNLAEKEVEPRQKRKEKKKKSEKKDREVPQSGDEEEQQEEAKPIGEPVRISGKGKGRRTHYEAFEFDGNRYDLVRFFFFFSAFGLKCGVFLRVLVCWEFMVFALEFVEVKGIE